MQLIAERRNIFGKKLKEARKRGKMPAVLYGKGVKTTPIFVSLNDFKKIFKDAGESSLIKIKLPFLKNKILDVLIQDVAFDPINSQPLHADFYAIEMDKALTAEIGLVFEGISPAVKEKGAILIKVIHQVKVEALPKNLPHELRIDISKLANIGDQILIKDIPLPEGVKILAKEDDVVAIAEEPKEEIVEEKPISMEEIEVEKRGKREEGVKTDEGDISNA